MFRKNTGSLVNYKRLICLHQTKSWNLQLKKGGVVWMEKRFGRVSLAKIISWENLSPFPSRIQRIMLTHGGIFSNSFSTCIGQQIQLYSSWFESRQHKFTDIGNIYFARRGPAQQQNYLRDLLPIHYFPLSVGNSKV